MGLGDSLRQAWTRRVPELLKPEQNLVLRDRLSRASAALEAAGAKYAVAGDASWVPRLGMTLGPRLQQLIDTRED